MKNYDLCKHMPVYATKELLDFCVKEYGALLKAAMDAELSPEDTIHALLP